MAPDGSSPARQVAQRRSGRYSPRAVAARRSEKDRGERSIVVTSNRLPFTIQRVNGQLERRPSSGGLITALEPVVRRRGGTWVGWAGTELRSGESIDGPASGYHVAAVRITEHEANRYYHGFSNRTLWPLLHSLPSRAGFDRRDWSTYTSVNARFAEVTAEHADEGALVWIHDYHLMLVPELLRRLRPDLHAVFFLDCAERRLGVRVDRRAIAVEHGDRAVPVGAFPIGIDFHLFEETAQKAPESAEKGRERIVLGVDRLDYTKGIPERIRAFERLLELHPEHREKVVFLQLAVPSRAQVSEYRRLKREIDELVGRVNGRFATAHWSPIRYLYRSVPRERLCALYRDAEVALITPLRDGMNLVAKEYVTCQVRDPGVLILSRMAGAAETMREALQVNPFDVDETAHAIHRALTMDEEERATRMASLRRRERRDDLHAWVESFLAAAAGAPLELQPLSDQEIHDWLRNFVKRYPLCLFLDYDGTLTPLTDHPSKATLSASMRAVLEACARRPDTAVAIVSGRAIADVREMVGHEGLIYAGNHGLEIEGPDMESYRHEDLLHYAKRAEAMAQELRGIEAFGAWTESKGPTLTFHVRDVAEAKRPELLQTARGIVARHGFQARDAHAALEARPPIGWDKGRAVLHVLRERFGRAWSEHVRVIYVGDDQTDEDAFRFLAGLALTFRVGAADTPTAATRRLPDVGAVEALVGWIARRPPAET
jgi:trehalose 6-phosphate synthase/phosphatase